MTDDDNSLGAFLHVISLDSAAADWIGLEYREEVGRHSTRAHAFRFVTEVEKHAAGSKPRDLFERLALRLPVDDVGHGHVALRNSELRVYCQEFHDPFRVRKIQRTQQH